MKKQELLQLKARMESRMDYLETEICELHALLQKCGFPEGIPSLKAALESILNEEPEER